MHALLSLGDLQQWFSEVFGNPQWSLWGFQGIPSRKGNNFFFFSFIHKTFCFSHGFDSLFVIKYLKTKFLSDVVAWDKILSNRGPWSDLSV